MTSLTERTWLEQCDDVLARLPNIVRELFYIRTNEEGFVKIIPNKPQMHYHRDRLSRGFGARDDILKARKHGFTTWKALEGLAFCLFIDGFSGAIFLHEKEASKNVFNICRWAYSRMPDEYKEGRKLDTDRKDALDFGGSTLYVYTAGARAEPWRSQTFHWLHESEVAFWPNTEITVAGAEEAVPRFGHICRESTPNGRANWWYDECHASQEDQIYNTKFHFYPWWWGVGNRLPLYPDEQIIPTDEELTIMEIAALSGFTLDHEQIKWRRSKTSNPMQAEKFYQEHPEDPESCFLASGSPIIPFTFLQKLIQQAEARPILDEVWMPGNGTKVVWRRPTGQNPYVISVDVAEGKEHGDWSVISTWEVQPDALVQTARTKLKCNPDELASRVVDEAREAKDALIAVERNAIGSEVVRKIELLGYYNQYRQLNVDGQPTHNGWYTNVKTKKLMVESFVEDVISGAVISHDTELWAQAMNVTRDEMGFPLFPKKKHDDIFIAACIASQAKEQAVRNRGGEASIVSMV